MGQSNDSPARGRLDVEDETRTAPFLAGLADPFGASWRLAAFEPQA